MSAAPTHAALPAHAADNDLAEQRRLARRESARHAEEVAHAIDHERNARVVAAILLSLLAILALAAISGAVWLLPDWLEQQKIEARMGPKPNLAPLPTMKVDMGGSGGLALDLTMQIELERGVLPGAVEPYIDRIADRMGDRLRDVGLERLNGSEGARLVKEMARSVVQQELKKIQVRDVLIESMVIRTPYSALPGPAIYSALPALLMPTG